MDEAAFAPEAPDAKLDQLPSQPVWAQGKRAKIGSIALTNDRILFVEGASGAGAGGLIESLLSAPLEMLAEAKERARVVVTLPQLTGGTVVPRRLVADLY